ncbi:hypothetical protein WJX84_004044 [Apatococcus fuscideae]|uniref:Activating signal cointegrator 1 complex subunit 3 n=1 Tax=Apatococcus fuscideae TaxID=2026836 RepID=A0AAW1TFK4_9CHLO
MDQGGANHPGEPSPAQAPRLTTMLRAFTMSGQSQPDLDAQYLQRSKLLAAKLKASSPAASLLAVKLIGAAPPKAARDLYDRYLHSVAVLLGGEAGSEEVQASAGSLWHKLANLPALAPAKAGYQGLAVRLKPYRAVAESITGQSTDHDLQGTVEAADKLKAWQATNKMDSPPTSGKALASQDEASAEEAIEFGADVHFVTPSFRADESLASLAYANTDPAALSNGHHDSREANGSVFGVHTLRHAFAGQAAAPQQAVPASWHPDEELEEELAPKQPMPAKLGATWLMEWYRKTSGEADETVATAIALSLLSKRSADEIASELLDLLGSEAMDQLGDLLSHRKVLAEGLRAQVEEQLAAEAPDKSAMPTYGTGVSVSSRSQQMMEKLERKDKRRFAKGKATGEADQDWLAVNGLSQLLEAEAMRKATQSGSQLLYADGLEFGLGDGSANFGQRALPKGTVRKGHKGYEEVRVPAIATAQPGPGEKMVLIEDLPEWAQLPFDGYKSLNRIQSRIFQTAFTSNQNLLVCAPTGAGKTNIAMVSVLREIGQHMRQGVIQKQDFKVVYVAPMKALAAEVTAAFSRRLGPMGLTVKELTGDMQLSKHEMMETQMIVTTPEKWDVITRKGGDVSVSATVSLLIIDEVHLLNDDRGAVIETIVARTQRQVEASQSMIRIVGLSATLPNCKDVATFLGVNHDTGLFYFDASYRPVPLEMQFVGVTERNILASKNIMDDVAYQKVVDSLKRGYQAMIFVHSRKDTGKTARALAVKAQNTGDMALFDCSEHPQYGFLQKDVKKSRNREVQDMFPTGFGMHHAGMLRSDRNLTERLFSEGAIKVLCCTATLAWGVNLPAHTVIIKGTQIYDAQKGSFTELGMLDVQQIFGRAGRPQFDDSGEGIIITQHAQLAHYLGLLTHQTPIESQFVQGLVDHLNAEIVLGTVTNVKEASLWLSYTYLFVRMLRNPLHYGIRWEEISADPRLEGHRIKLITDAARELERCKMARFDENSRNLYVTELGRVASHYYIKHSSIVTFNELLSSHMGEADVLSMIAQSSEFENVAMRDDELLELDTLARQACPCDVRGGAENKHGKVNILLQAYVSRTRLESFSLTADMMYISQNAPRIARALFEITLRRGWSSLAELMLTLSKAFELRQWAHQHPLRQFEQVLSQEVLFKMEDRGLTMERLETMDPREIGAIIRHPAQGPVVASCLAAFPTLQLDVQIQPITRTVLRVQLTIEPTFEWRQGMHGNSQRWHIWVEDSENEHIYHTELWTLTKKMASEPSHSVSFTIPIFEPLPPQYYVRAVSDQWLNAETTIPVSFKSLILPDKHPPHTELLNLDPLPLSALDEPSFESLYKFSHFNPIQTQAFHTLYHTDENALLGAPTGSGKTIVAELAMLRVFREHPGQKVIYIAPLKALVRERMKDWGTGLCRILGKKMVELTGDYTPDLRALLAADIIIATPEKWDGISRAWQNRGYVRKVALLVIDEIHLLGGDRGPILEVIVSRMRYISAQTEQTIRFLGLSTALANAVDLADWLGIKPQGLFNFKPSVRPVPLECHIQGYAGRFYCPRMATMNKPAYAAIQTYCPLKPILIFVSSRRQTRLTALDLIGFAAAEERARQFVHMPEDELDQILASIKEPNLRHTLQFGIGLHHAGLSESDRSIAETLFVAGKIQILVATSTLAWGVNTPAHLVIIKGTEYFDAPSRRYVDFPITDVLQMMGRAGRPQYDRHGVAVIMVHEPKKSFYKKFLYEPFPVESSLQDQVADHFNAEVVAGTIASKQDAVDYLTWTFFFRRLLQNPAYYDMDGTDSAAVNAYLSGLVNKTLLALEDAGCLTVDEEDQVEPQMFGQVASFYYLKHETMAVFAKNLTAGLGIPKVLEVLCSAREYDELPVRHNEDQLNTTLCGLVRFPPDARTADDPHTKANLLLQAHMSRLPAPISDYVTDTKGALDNSVRLLQAITDLAADAGWLETALSTMLLIQSLMQGIWWDDPPMKMLPHMTDETAEELVSEGLRTLHQLRSAAASQPAAMKTKLSQLLGGSKQASECLQVCERLPVMDIHWNAPTQASTAGRDGDDGAVEEAETWDVEIHIRRQGRRRGTAASVYAPRFPKVKEEGWWLVLGDPDTQELFALKRISFTGNSTARLQFPGVNGAGRRLEGVQLFFISDSYVGVDQQHWVGLRGAPPSHHGSGRPQEGSSSTASSTISTPASGQPGRDLARSSKGSRRSITTSGSSSRIGSHSSSSSSSSSRNTIDLRLLLETQARPAPIQRSLRHEHSIAAKAQRRSRGWHD